MSKRCNARPIHRKATLFNQGLQDARQREAVGSGADAIRFLKPQGGSL
jgi:hypothetical protein